MVNINDFKQFVEFISNKSGMGSYVSPDEFNLNAYRAVMEFTMKRYGNPQEYQNGRPIPRITYEKTQKIIDDLRHLKEVHLMNVVNGEMNIPDGVSVTNSIGTIIPEYMHLSTLTYNYITNNDCNTSATVRKKSVEILKDDEVAVRCDSDLVPPTLNYPTANIQNSYIRFYPVNISQVEMVYLRQPNKPLWNYTVVSNRFVYDATTSVDLDIPKEAFNEVAMMYLSYLGLRIREQQLVQYAETQKQQGV